MKPTQPSKGFSLVETIIYTVILGLILAALISTLSSVTSAYRSIKTSQALQGTAANIMERLSRDIRNGITLDAGNSSFGTSLGRLTLSSKDGSGSARTVEYVLLGNTLRIREGGVDKGALNASSTPVNSLVFRSISTGNSTAIKVELTVSAFINNATTTETFNSTYIMRGSY